MLAGGDWLVWQLADSAFPTGGFAHSGGLEAAWQQGEVTTQADLQGFLEASLNQAVHGPAQFVKMAHAEPQRLAELDRLCEAFLTNHVANRASRQQGQALLLACERCFGPDARRPSLNQKEPSVGADVEVGHAGSSFDPFPLTPALSLGEREWLRAPRGSCERARSVLQQPMLLPLPEGEGRGEGEGTVRSPVPSEAETHCQECKDRDLPHARCAPPTMGQLRSRVLSERLPGHFAPCFGAVAHGLGLEVAVAIRLFVFLQLRGLVAAAVRLGVVGPLEGQALQYHFTAPAAAQAGNDLQDASRAEREVARALALNPDDLAQTAPLADLFQGAHDRLYSRLFQS